MYIMYYIYIYLYIYICINAIMKTMCSPGYHHNGYVAIHALGPMMYGCSSSTLLYVNALVRSGYRALL